PVLVRFPPHRVAPTTAAGALALQTTPAAASARSPRSQLMRVTLRQKLSTLLLEYPLSAWVLVRATGGRNDPEGAGLELPIHRSGLGMAPLARDLATGSGSRQFVR